MGVSSGFWQYLSHWGLVELIVGEGEIYRELHGKIIAIDIANWLYFDFESAASLAIQQQNIKKSSSIYKKSALQITFSRLLQWVRNGVKPIIVVDGIPPASKYGPKLSRPACTPQGSSQRDKVEERQNKR